MKCTVKHLTKIVLATMVFFVVGCDEGSTISGPEAIESGHSIVMQGDYPVEVPNALTARSSAAGPALQTTASSDACFVQSFDAARTGGSWGLTESYLTGTRGYLQDAASFGAGGVVSTPVTVGAGVSTVSAATLADADVFFTGYVLSSSYSAAEKQALLDFVLAGGAVIGTTDNTFYTMTDIFDVTQGDGGSSANTVTNAAHPIASGPFGPVTNYTQYFSIGHYSDLGAYAVEIGANSIGTSIAAIPEGAIAPGSGRVVMVADVDVFSDFGGSAANEVLIKNIFAYACEDPVIEVAIDIKPGSDPNSINCNNDNLTISVAILTTDDFDATTVDHTTVEFEGATETRIDKKTGIARRSEEDVDNDGDMDLVLHFKNGETNLDCSSTSGTLTGQTFDGQAIQGTDAVNSVDASNG